MTTLPRTDWLGPLSGSNRPRMKYTPAETGPPTAERPSHATETGPGSVVVRIVRTSRPLTSKIVTVTWPRDGTENSRRVDPPLGLGNTLPRVNTTGIAGWPCGTLTTETEQGYAVPSLSTLRYT